MCKKCQKEIDDWGGAHQPWISREARREIVAKRHPALAAHWVKKVRRLDDPTGDKLIEQSRPDEGART